MPNNNVPINKCLRHLMLLCICLALSFLSQAQQFARLKVNTKSVYKQQAVKASITVYTSTWFTDSPEMDALSIPNTFVLPFKRTVSGIQYVDNTKYATLEFFYLLFPFEAGEITIPELTISIFSPPEGGYKGLERKLKTKPVTIQVKDEVEQFDGSQWFVAKNAYINEQWNQPLNELKVGNVIERTISIRAVGALPAFIPESSIKDEEWASIYPKQAELKDTRTNVDANGLRIEKYQYLLEKEGTFNIEPINITWYNPYLGQQYSRKTNTQQLIVKPNPDLGMLTSIRDSLDTATPLSNEAGNNTPFSLLGLSLKQLTRVILACLLLTWLLFRMIRWMVKKIAQRKALYLQSEKYQFDVFEQSHKHNASEQLNALYRWLLLRKDKRYTIDSQSETAHSLIQSVYTQSNKSLTRKEIKQIKKDLTKKAREQVDLYRINP
ncbi:MAG: BatD family protein [Carboxylicivirga sp.]|nr:BatD family protein [Carboxylicivirga sp.]